MSTYLRADGFSVDHTPDPSEALKFANQTTTARMFDFMRGLVRDHESYGLARPPETFPKQRGVTADTPYGNWVRLPGRHHKREDHWSRFWDGSRWLEGGAAVEFLLSFEGDDPELIPEPEPEPDRPTQDTPFTLRATGNRPSLETLLGWAVRRVNPGSNPGRNQTAYDLGQQMRDNGYGQKRPTRRDGNSPGWFRRRLTPSRRKRGRRRPPRGTRGRRENRGGIRRPGRRPTAFAGAEVPPPERRNPPVP